MLNVHTEAELLEDAPLPLDHLILQVDVVLVEQQWHNGPARRYKATLQTLHMHTFIHWFSQQFLLNIQE